MNNPYKYLIELLMMNNRTLAELRAEIDITDSEITALLLRRFGLAVNISANRLKKNVCDPEREAEVLRRAVAAAGPEFADNVAAVYAEIIKQSKKVQL